MTAKKIQKIEIDYKNGLKYQEIENKYKISHKDLRNLVKTQKWTRNSNRSKVTENNKNAVTTGEYESIYKDVLDDDELEFFNNYSVKSKVEELEDELKLLNIREKRMLKRIADLKHTGKDLTISSITRNKSSTTEYGGTESESSSTYAESTVEKIQRIEEALTRIQEAKRRCIESLHKFELDDNNFELKLLRLEKEVSSETVPETENDAKSSLLEALNSKASEVWLNDSSEE